MHSIEVSISTYSSSRYIEKSSIHKGCAIHSRIECQYMYTESVAQSSTTLFGRVLMELELDQCCALLLCVCFLVDVAPCSSLTCEIPTMYAYANSACVYVSV